MSDPAAPIIKPARHSAVSPPPRNRLTDDILAHLGPRTAVDALSTATGALRICLTGASLTDRDFTMRTAVISKTIWEWVDELQNWPWPSEAGPAGFEMPSGKRKRLSIQITISDENDNDYMGSLPAKDVIRYEKRLAQIQHDLNTLDIEEVKAHVLNNHILPLSRPGTPLSEFTRSGVLSSSSYNRMEDLTAVITAIVVKALPNLAKLSRLLNTWTLRLSVVRCVPSLLLAIEDAEVAVGSGWNAISLPSTKTPQQQDEQSPRGPTLIKKDFDVMKLILEKKVAQPGRSLDFMLDSLEGLPDTLPDEWLDRMEAVETSYAEWVAACERKMRETEWARSIPSRSVPQSPSPVKHALGVEDSPESSAMNESLIVEGSFSDSDSSFGSDVEIGPIPLRLPRPQVSSIRTGDPRKVSGVSEASEAETVVPDQPKYDSFLVNEPASPSLIITEDVDEPKQQLADTFNGTGDVASPSIGEQPPTPTTQTHPDYISRPPQTPNHSFATDPEALGDTPSLIVGNESPDLPPLRMAARRHSDVSQNSIITRRESSHFDGLSSDLPEVSASPDLPRTRIREAEYLQASPPSSPPLPDTHSRESLMPPFDSPLIAPKTDDDFLMANVMDDSFTDDFDDSISLSEFTSSFHDRRGSAGDQQLQQQISQIISSIPAKIKLSNELPAINLNPPDLQLPRLRKRPSIDPYKRSTSSLSSRAGTPSFTLSPAKNTKARSRGQQEIKVYHLSRSTGEAPIKLFIRCVGEQGERVMVRVGGGWADLGEYLKEYANHHKRRSASGKNTKVEIQEQPHVQPSGRRSNMGSSPSARPASALELSPMTPLVVRKTRRSVGALSSESPRLFPKTPVVTAPAPEEGPSSEESNRSRSSSRLSWAEDDSSFLGLAGPTGKKVEMSEENKAWVESVKEKVRLASGEHRISSSGENRFGELGKVGGTKRLFRKNEERRESRGNR
ncbi:hypothetical protein B0J13DRAFT_261283 [Dactylonectria estremocensis]|uniref:GAR domain-containing protein n=1 Tax=Dactylonectria estremocensis TaxID=1079267 RepID=A0A9P9F470_9HYPO|nr:hypothetical protein B0J13DRAFT_261283 [Dactylonectria estremocensis]